MQEISIYHNPRCSKSRAALNLITEHGYEPKVIEYLKTPPSQSELKAILKYLNLQPRELMRQNEKEFKALNLDNDELSRDELIDAMIQHPILIQRPIIIKGNNAVIGRPPELVLELLS